MEKIHTSYESAEILDFPGVMTVRILLEGSKTDGSITILEDIVEPGVGAPRHIHHDQDETFFFLEGNFDVEIGGERHHMKAGDVAFIPKGTIHAFKNVGKEKGRLRYIFTPGLNIENMFRTFHEVSKEKELGPDEMAAIASKFGQEIVGPPID